jgi:hypothetical protein
MLLPGKFKVTVTWKAPCGKQVVDTGADSRNIHMAECRGCAEAFIEKQRKEQEKQKYIAPPEGKRLWVVGG